MNRPLENAAFSRRIPPMAGLTAAIGGLLAAAWSLSMLYAVLANAPAFYRAEVHAVSTVLAAISGEAMAGVVFAAAWVPIVICVIAFAIVIAGVAIIIWTTWVQQALAWISRQAALCPTLPWWQRSICWSAVAAAVTALTAALGIFFTAAAVVMINVIVVLFL